MPRGLTRREFIKATTGVGAVIATGCKTSRVVDRHIIGSNSRLNVAMIGAGGQGAGNTNMLADHADIVALCDVDLNRLAKQAAQYPKAQTYQNWRECLDQPAIDAVCVSTPDHNHAVISMEAIKRGMHVYCEKPLTHSVYEARMLTEAARQYKTVTQMGNAGHAGEPIRRLCEMVWNGAIGPVRQAHAWSNRPSWPQAIDRPTDPSPVPTHLDWDLWLGPAPNRPYHPCYHPHNWRGWWDFGTGALGDMGCHIIDYVYSALKLKHPLTVEAESSPVFAETGPLWSIVTYQFSSRSDMPPVTLKWYDGQKLPPRPAELEAERSLPSNGIMLEGDDGKILMSHGGGPRIIPEKKMKEYKLPPKTIPRSPGNHQEWVEACVAHDPEMAKGNWDYSGPLTETVLLGNLAVRSENKIEWHPDQLKVKKSKRGAQLLRRKYRKGWRL